jgi:uncharacterized protein YukE
MESFRQGAFGEFIQQIEQSVEQSLNQMLEPGWGSVPLGTRAFEKTIAQLESTVEQYDHLLDQLRAVDL